MVGFRLFLVFCVLCAVEPAELTDTNTRDDVAEDDGVQVLEQVVRYLNPKSRRSIEEDGTGVRQQVCSLDPVSGAGGQKPQHLLQTDQTVTGKRAYLTAPQAAVRVVWVVVTA
uniref:Secreted protein n=1 Tax=Branchiostoma floridae TaxID=7739 RepID=C3ZFP5_BRAFL|eukprot:XP_002592642.1 hypothetical protein BRAFLDRAFT_85113 [Branchiostoma floridae]